MKIENLNEQTQIPDFEIAADDEVLIISNELLQVNRDAYEELSK